MTELEIAGSPPATLQQRVESLRLAKDIRVPPRRGGKLFWFVILGIFAGIGVWAYANYGDKIRSAFSTAPASSPSPSATSAAEKEKIAPNVAKEAGGYVVARLKVQVSPKVGGQVKMLDIYEGKLVKEGAILAKLEDNEYLFEYERTTAMAELAEAKYKEAKKGNREEEKEQAFASEREADETLRQAKEELSKIRASGGAITRDELDKAESRVRIAEHKLIQQKAMNKIMQKGPREERIEAAKAEFEQAQAEQRKAKWRLDSCVVKAPINGVILEKKTELGNTVRPEAFSNGLSASVCDMADLKDLEVEVDISERDIRDIYAGQKCLIQTEAYKDKRYNGLVARIMPVASRSKASVTVRVKIIVPDDEKDLRPEMRARVQFLRAAADKPATPVPTTTAATK